MKRLLLALVVCFSVVDIASPTLVAANQAYCNVDCKSQEAGCRGNVWERGLTGGIAACHLYRRQSQRDRAMSTAYEDNFGFYCSDDNPEELAFFMHIKRQSIAKVCVRCNQNVHLQPQRILCATCTQALEYGAPSDLAWAVPDILVARGGT